MAAYRANPFEYINHGINKPPAIANVQQIQAGHALSQTKVDSLGRPRVVSAFNRNIHRVDFATRKPPPGQSFMRALNPVGDQASVVPTRYLAAPIFTKAYKDGIEYLKAEKDYRAREKRLDEITPSRRSGWSANLTGTAASQTGPVPDSTGYAFANHPTVQMNSGQVFSAPGNYDGQAPTVPIRPGAKVRRPVLVGTQGRIVRTMPDGTTVMGSSTGVMVHPPVNDADVTEMEVDVPSLHRTVPKKDIEVLNSPQPILVETEREVKTDPIPTQVASDHKDPSNVKAILEHNQVYGTLRAIPAVGPFTATKHDNPKAIQLDRKILPNARGVFTNRDGMEEKGVTILDPTALAIPVSLHVPKAGATVVTQEVGTARTTTGVADFALAPIRVNRGQAAPIVERKRIADDYPEGESSIKRSKKNPPAPRRKAAVRTRVPDIRTGGDPVPPRELPGVRKLARRNQEDPEYGIASFSPSIPIRETVRLRKAEKEDLSRPIKKQKLNEAASRVSRIPRAVTRAPRALTTNIVPPLAFAPPPQEAARVDPQPTALRKLARRNREDPEFGIGSAVPSEPIVERVRLRKAQEEINRPVKRQKRNRLG